MDSVEKTNRKRFKVENMAAGSSDQEMSVDWRGRPCRPNTHGGMTAAVFVLGISLSLSQTIF